MFGLTTPRRDWTRSVSVDDRPCQLCHALEADYGRLARSLTNHDAGFLLSLLEAQAKTTSPSLPSSLHCGGSVCRLYRPGWAPTYPRYVAALLVIWFSIKLQDDIRDGNRLQARLLWKVSQRRILKARSIVSEMGLDLAILDDQIGRQLAAESVEWPSLETLSRPTATAMALAFSHTACLADLPANSQILTNLGDRFGRLVYLTDAYTDFDRDRRQGQFNALRAAFPTISQCSRKQIPSPMKRQWFEQSWDWSQAMIEDLRALELTSHPPQLESAIAQHLRENLMQLYQLRVPLKNDSSGLLGDSVFKCSS